MDVVHPRCCGLDIHKKTVVACVVTPGAGGRPAKAIRSFGTMTDDLLKLGDWLREAGVTPVAMESTGVYWIPVYNLLEGGFTLLLVNAQHMHAVPGRKTDVKDCEWIAELLRHGLLRASFVPERSQRELRELVRYRTTLVEERAAEVNRLQKTLEGGNIKLGSVASNVLGKSGRAMVAALAEGTTDGAVLAGFAKGQLRQKTAELERALSGRMAPHQRFLLAQHLAHIDFLEEQIERVNQEVSERLAPFAAAVERLDVIPGVGRLTAEVIVAVIGIDMSRFPTAGHLASWAGLCPGNNESAGKRLSGKTRKGNGLIRRVLVEAAHAAGRTKGTYLAAQYHRLAGRRGKKKAAIAVAHSILVIAYHLLKDPETPYTDLGAHYFDQRDKEALQRRYVRRLEGLGYRVICEPVEPAA